MAKTTVTMRLSRSEKRLLADYAKTSGTSISEFARAATLAHIEDELDLVAWGDAKRQFEADSSTLTADEVATKYL